MTSSDPTGPGGNPTDVPTPAEVFAVPEALPPTAVPEPHLELADLVAAAAMAVDGVAGLHTGMFGEVATYLPGRRVDGIRIATEVTEVHLVLVWGAPVLATADAVRAAVQPLVTTRVDVAVQDVVDPSAGSAALSSSSKEIS